MVRDDDNVFGAVVRAQQVDARPKPEPGRGARRREHVAVVRAGQLVHPVLLLGVRRGVRGRDPGRWMSGRGGHLQTRGRARRLRQEVREGAQGGNSIGLKKVGRLFGCLLGRIFGCPMALKRNLGVNSIGLKKLGDFLGAYLGTYLGAPWP